VFFFCGTVFIFSQRQRIPLKRISGEPSKDINQVPTKVLTSVVSMLLHHRILALGMYRRTAVISNGS
jgi:hypothetical protein